MDSVGNSDETCDLGYQPSQSSLDQNDQSSSTEATSFSLQSGYSFCRTNSDVSAFSEPTDDNSSTFSETPSPLCWPGMKSPKTPVLSKLVMQQQNPAADDETENEDLGGFCKIDSFPSLFFLVSLVS